LNQLRTKSGSTVGLQDTNAANLSDAICQMYACSADWHPSISHQKVQANGIQRVNLFFEWDSLFYNEHHATQLKACGQIISQFNRNAHAK
jgi:hypothetical protein